MRIDSLYADVAQSHPLHQAPKQLEYILGSGKDEILKESRLLRSLILVQYDTDVAAAGS